ncbi:MAG: hypothetical protein J7480_07295 [Microbacteriaceae bacterium]|nr:hypothetical protein [Microbacteriaceae bacterium]
MRPSPPSSPSAAARAGALAGAFCLALLLGGCVPGAGPAPSPSPSGTPSAAPSRTPSPRPTVIVEPSPVPAPDPTPTAPPADPVADALAPMPAERRQSIVESITSWNTAVLEGYLQSVVHFGIAASDGVGDLTPAQTVEQLTHYVTGKSWGLAGPVVLADAQSSFYGEHWFSPDAIVLVAESGEFVSLDPKGGPLIVSVLYGVHTDLLY